MTDRNPGCLAPRPKLHLPASRGSPGNLQLGKGGGVLDFLQLVAVCSWLCPLLHSTLSLGTGHPRVVTSGVRREEEFCLGCTFLPSLWGGQQRSPISAEYVGGRGDSGFCLPFLGKYTHSSFLGPGHSKRALGHQHAHSCQLFKSPETKYFKNPFISLLAHKSLVTCYFKVGSRSKEAGLWALVTDLISSEKPPLYSTFQCSGHVYTTPALSSHQVSVGRVFEYHDPHFIGEEMKTHRK